MIRPIGEVSIILTIFLHFTHTLKTYSKLLVKMLANLSQFQDFISYWLELRGEDNILPCHKDFQPSRLKKLLPRLMIAEHVPENNYFSVRLCGTEIVERIGFELTHTRFGYKMREKKGVWHVSTEMLDIMTRHPVGVMGRHRWLTLQGYYNCDFIYLPFECRDGSPNELFLLCEFDAKINSSRSISFKEFGDVTEAYALDLGQGIAPGLQYLPSLAIS